MKHVQLVHVHPLELLLVFNVEMLALKALNWLQVLYFVLVEQVHEEIVRLLLERFVGVELGIIAGEDVMQHKVALAPPE